MALGDHPSCFLAGSGVVPRGCRAVWAVEERLAGTELMGGRCRGGRGGTGGSPAHLVFAPSHLPQPTSKHKPGSSCGQRWGSFCTEGQGGPLLSSQHPARQGVHLHGLYRLLSGPHTFTTHIPSLPFCFVFLFVSLFFLLKIVS